MYTGSIVLGKDRVLVQFNMDLRWLYLLLTDKNQWSTLWSKTIQFLQTNIFHKFSKRKILKNEMLYIVSDIRFKNPNSASPIKCFYGNIDELIDYSKKHKKLILLYMEDGSAEFPSTFSTSFRSALSHTHVSHLINQHFLFYAVTTRAHYYFKKLYQIYSKLYKFPILLVISPNKEPDDDEEDLFFNSNDDNDNKSKLKPNTKIKIKTRTLLEICDYMENNLFAAILLPPPELNGDNILHFLHRYVCLSVWLFIYALYNYYNFVVIIFDIHFDIYYKFYSY